MSNIQGTVIINERDGVLPPPAIRPKLGHCGVIYPLEAAKILIFSQNYYDFRTQHPNQSDVSEPINAVSRL